MANTVPGASTPISAGASLRAGVVLIAAIVLAAMTVLVGPGLVTGAVLPYLGAGASEPLVETLFNGLVFGTLIAIAAIGGAASGVNAFAAGRNAPILLGLGLFVGLFGVTVTAGYSALAGVLTVGDGAMTSGALILWGAAVVLVQAAAEEIYFRGWIQPVVAQAWGTGIAVIVAALAFAGLHVLGGARAPITLVNLLLGGILFGLLAAWGRGIMGAVAAHFAWNGAEQLVLGLDPNPGIGSFGSLFDFELVGAQAWGGSEEGLNASVAMTFTLVALLIPMLLLMRRRLAHAA